MIKTAFLLLMALVFGFSSTLWANQLEVPTQDFKPVRVYQGETSPHDGVLFSLESAYTVQKMKESFEIYKKDYKLYGPVKVEPSKPTSDKWAFSGMLVVAGFALGGAALGSASKEAQNMALAASALGVVTGVVLLVWD